MKENSNNPTIPQAFTPPKGFKSPYKAGKLNKNTFSTDYQEIKLNLDAFQAPLEADPTIYISANDYQKSTGRLLKSLATDQTNSMFEQNKHSEVKGTKVGDKFIEQDGSLYFFNKDKLSLICNFTIKILGINRRIKFDGTFIEFVDIEVNKLNDEIISVPFKQYKTLFTSLTGRHPHLRQDALFGSRAKAYFDEYASIVYEMALKNLKIKQTYAFHGWTNINNKMLYLSSAYDFCECDCFIPSVANENIQLIYTNGLSFLKVGEIPSNSSNRTDSSKSILPIFLYAHAGYTAELFLQAGLNLQFILAIIGTTGSFKTSLCKALCESFNTQSMLNFQSTPTAIELYRDTCRDMSIIMDDIFSCKDKEAMTKFETILRCFGDNIAKAKSNSTANKIQQFTVRGGCIITAENDLPTQQSSALRCLTVKVNNNSFNGNILKYFQDNQSLSRQNKTPSIMQLYFSAYIDFLQSNFYEIVEEIRTFEPLPLKIKFPRLFATYKAMCILGHIIVKWGVKIGVFSAEESVIRLNIWYSIIQELVIENQQMSEIAAPYKLFISHILQGMATGIFPLAINKKIYTERGSKDYFGYIDEENNLYVLDPNKSFKFLDDFVKNNGHTLSFTQQTLLHQLYDKNISIGYKETYKSTNGEVKERTRYTKKIIINKISAQMLLLKIAAINAVANE